MSTNGTTRNAPPLTDQIDAALDVFEPAKVVAAMRALNWTWITLTGVHVPSEAQIIAEIRRQVQVIKTRGHSAMSSGGVRVENRDGWLRIAFELTAASWTPTGVEPC